MHSGHPAPSDTDRDARWTSDARSAGRGALTLGALQSVGRVLALAFFITATRAVAPAAFGRYSTVAAVLLIVGFLSDLGTTAATTKLVSTGTDADRLLTDSMSACLALGLLAWSVGEVVVVLGYPHILAVDFAVLGASLPVDACLSTLAGALDGSGAIARRALVSFARVGLGAVGAGVLVVLTGSIRWAMFGLVLGPVVGLCLAYIYARRLGIWTGRFHVDPRGGKPLLITAAPYALIGGASVLSARVDVVAVSLVASRATTAAYDVAVRVLEGPLFIVTVLSGPMLFLFSRRLAKGDVDGVQRAFDQVARMLFVVGIPISVVLVTLSGPLVRFAFGAGYATSNHLLAILGGQLWLMFLCGLQGSVLSAMPRMRRVVAIVGLVALVQVILQVVLIVVAGPTGGAVSYAFQSAVTFLAYAAFVRHEVGVRTLRLPSIPAIAAGIIAAVVALSLRHFQLEVSLGASLGAYVLAAGSLGALSGRDVGGLRDLLSRQG